MTNQRKERDKWGEKYCAVVARMQRIPWVSAGSFEKDPAPDEVIEATNLSPDYLHSGLLQTTIAAQVTYI